MDEMKRILGVALNTTPGGQSGKAVQSESEFVDFNKSMESGLRGKVKELEDHKWKIPFMKGEMEVMDVVEKFIDVTALAQNFVGAALASSPSGALAWSAVCFGIQVRHCSVSENPC
jgi:hypothetical protein